MHFFIGHWVMCGNVSVEIESFVTAYDSLPAGALEE